MCRRPVLDEADGAGRKVALDEFKGADVEPADVVSMHGMKMGRIMILEEHFDADAIESGDGGHGGIDQAVARTSSLTQS